MIAQYPQALSHLLLFAGLVLISPYMTKAGSRSRLLLALAYAVLTIRYLQWRFAMTLQPLGLDLQAIWVWVFFVFEALASVLLIWHFLIMVRQTDRRHEAADAEARLRSSGEIEAVDILIPTYNEPEAVLRRTILAAVALDYPAFTVWILDDGGRPWLKELCRLTGARYLSRQERRGFKAGNLNYGLTQTRAPLVAVADADFALKPQFLWRTTGLLKDPKIGVVQTPQIYRNPDAIQYNLGGTYAWPEAQCMFTDLMQPGRDSWDNAFCYGTSFVARRSCFEAIGGIPEATIAEDIHMTYLLLSGGFKTRFLNEPLSEGYATQDIGQFVVQRSRWCAGSLQCFLAEGGVLRSKRLSFLDRLFFLDPILYHLTALWVLCLLLAPALYWWFGLVPFHSELGQLVAAFAPRMLLGIFGLYWMSRRKTIPVIADIERVVGVFYLTRAIANVMLHPFRQTFRTTSKDAGANETRAYWHVIWPHTALLGVTLAGLAWVGLGLAGEPLFMRTDDGMMVTLTAYVLWLLFLACLAGVQRGEHHAAANAAPPVRTGSVRAVGAALIRRVFLP